MSALTRKRITQYLQKDDDATIPLVKYTKTDLIDLLAQDNKASVDVVGVICNVSEKVSIRVANQDEPVDTRNVEIADANGHKVGTCNRHSTLSDQAMT